MLPSISKGEARGKIVKNSEFYIVLSLLLVIFVISFILLQNLYCDYDEFFNLQIPKNLVENGQYATYYNLEYHLFNPMITTGPSVLIPIAIFFKIFGTNYLVSRFIMLCFFILMCLFLYIVSREFFGRKVAYLSLIFVILIPGSFTIGLKVLGEIPAVMYLLIGVYLLCIYEKQNNKKIILLFFSGVFFAFSVLTKLLFSVVLFPIILYIIFHKERWKTKVTLPASFLSTLFVWEAYQIGVLGIDKYIWLKMETIYVLTTHGASTKPVLSELLINKIYFLSTVFGIRVELLLTIVAIFTVFCIVLFIDGFKKNKLPLVGYITFTALSIAFWFLFIDRIYFRHVLPYLILCIPPFLYLMAKLFDNFRNSKGSKNKKLLFIMLLAIVTFSVIFSTLHVTTEKINEYVDQKSFLETQEKFIQEIINTIPSNSKIGYWDWWKAPEISYFVSNDFLDLSGFNSLVVFKGERLSPNFVVVSPYQISHDPTFGPLKPFLGDVAINVCGEKGCYILYKYREGWGETLVKARWISTDARIIIDSQEDQESNLYLELTSFHEPRTLQCYLNGKLIHEQVVSPKFVKLEIPIKLKKGENVLRFYTPDGCERPCDFSELKNPDARCLSFAFTNITLQ